VLQYKKISPFGYAPTRGSNNAAGLDLWASRDVMVPAHRQVRVHTDIEVALPPGTYGRIAPRSSLAFHHSIDVGGEILRSIRSGIDLFAILD
jgi:dUTP pyrophosphatase